MTLSANVISFFSKDSYGYEKFSSKRYVGLRQRLLKKWEDKIFGSERWNFPDK